jgi:hypothetical protein
MYLYPVGTAVVVVSTGNHWVLDAVVGLLVTLTGIRLAAVLERPHLRCDGSTQSPPRATGPEPRTDATSA